MIYPWFENQFNGLMARAKQQKLHHGLLFIGSRGTGKSEILQQMARNLLCVNKSACGQCQSCTLYAAGNHPDLILTPYEKTIGVDVIREGISRLNQTSHLGLDKILIIENAHKMTVAASNALLKTLEEPTRKTYILMSATSANELLPTILSRCEKQLVQITDKAIVEQWLQAQGTPSDTLLLALYWSRPLLINAILKDEALLECFDWLKNLQKINSSGAMPNKLLEEHHLLLDWMAYKLNEVKRSEISDELSLKVFAMHNELLSASKTLNMQGVNKTLIIEKMLQSWRQFSTLL